MKILFLMLFLSTSSFSQAWTDTFIDSLQSDFQYQTDLTDSTTPAINFYLDYYSLPDSFSYRFKTVISDSFRLAVQIFSPVSPEGSALIVHGYNAHAGLQQQLIRYLLKHNLRVALYDQPGHGLSSGEMAIIGEFSEYGQALTDVIRELEGELPEPRLLMGHSMGCATILTWLRQSNQPEFEHLVFLAPLVRHRFWELGKFSTKLVSPLRESVPRRFKPSSSDTAFVRFWKQDPLMGRNVPLDWAKALYRWNKEMEKETAFTGKILIVQGDLDRVVDWRFNLPFLAERFEEKRVYLIEGARHQLQNEGSPILRRVLQQIGFFAQDMKEEFLIAK